MNALLNWAEPLFHTRVFALPSIQAAINPKKEYKVAHTNCRSMA